MTDTDQHLTAIADRDAVAFGRWMAETERTLRDGLRPFAASVDTEAVLQETFLRLWQVAPRFVPDGRPDGLLRLGLRIAKNLAISETRHHRTRPVDAAVLDETVQAEVAPPPDPLLARVIAACRDKLPKKPGEALAARIESGGSDPDETLAERLGMRVNTFLQNVTRAKKMLAECLAGQGVDLFGGAR